MMDLLTERDSRILNECMEEIGAHRHLPTFLPTIIAVLPKLISSEYPCFNAIHLETQKSHIVIDPPEACSSQREEFFRQYVIPEHCLIRYYQECHYAWAIKYSDFLERHKFHDTGVYREFYKEYGVDEQMSIVLPGPPSWVFGISLCRSGQDFSEGDKQRLNWFRARLIAEYWNLEAATQVQTDVVWPVQALNECLHEAHGLTKREVQVVSMAAQGHVTEQIAASLGSTRNTVKSQLEDSYAKILWDRWQDMDAPRRRGTARTAAVQRVQRTIARIATQP